MKQVYISKFSMRSKQRQEALAAEQTSAGLRKFGDLLQPSQADSRFAGGSALVTPGKGEFGFAMPSVV